MTFTNQQLIDQAREEVDFLRECDELIPSQQTAIRLRLAEITLAALTAEPVYQLINYDWYDTTKDVYESVVSAGGRGRIVYTAPPAPVVPPAIEPDYDVIKGILPTSNPDEYACCIAADMWNACRAAMLAAVPQQGAK
ncbi:hypothetical protein [Leclercia adecarboxylata]|uniref:hypothetical protein n=1 Tax=Leclercia adecarboxylata TaxID=83655 RepID=UPI003018CAF7